MDSDNQCQRARPEALGQAQGRRTDFSGYLVKLHRVTDQDRDSLGSIATFYDKELFNTFRGENAVCKARGIALRSSAEIEEVFMVNVN